MRNKNDDINRRYLGITEGTVVKCKDGEKLGKISAVDQDSFVVRQGFFFPKDFSLRYEDVAEVRDGEVIINACHADLAQWQDDSYEGWNQVDDINAGRVEATPRAEFQNQYENSDTETEDVRVPVVEEQLEAQKTVRQSGQVRVRKVVHTELQHFTVPVMKEEIEVERVPITEGRLEDAESDAFEEKEITIPLMQEEVNVTKKPVVKEEVRIHKKRTQEEQDVSDTVRKEEVEIDEDLPKRKLG